MISSLFNGSISATACSTSAIPFPRLFGAEFLSMEANFVANLSQNVHIGLYSNHGAVSVKNLNYCNVTVSYTHPGQNDTVVVQVWMPSDTWNGRLQAIGGAGFQAGLHYAGLQGMIGAMGEGYATVGTDAGLGSAVYPTTWGLISEGNVNLYLLQNLASVSLNDAAVISKSIINSFYGQPPKYSYFNGCSQGGRQGMMLAQRYPEAYDGIASSAPAINWNELFTGLLWPAFLMDNLGEYPPSCEVDALTQAAIAACDGLDGVIDGVITDPDTCTFDPTTLVGTVINCTNFGTERPISAAAATIVKGAWDGPKRVDNSSIWFGVGQDSVLTDTTIQPGLISTTCSSNETCTINEVELSGVWVQYFLNRNSSSSTRFLSHEAYDQLSHASVQMYQSIIGTQDPDLSVFRNRGGKIVGYHGTSDNVIPLKGSTSYYDKVMALDPNSQDFYRMFLAPGIGHCFGGSGAFPDTTFDAMRQWVEEGTAPDTLMATSVSTSPIIKRPLCPYPKKQMYDGVGNVTAGEGFFCV
ncbi:feruloyl esterase-like protein B precursor [Thozetella sp. PMI_491]|nr:feruloyl esterase-like protein B precursor [Thozetella sp. PMI_491]